MTKFASLRRRLLGTGLASGLLLAPFFTAHAEEAGLLFHLTADHGLTADLAKGEAPPNLVNGTTDIKQDPVHGAYLSCSGQQSVAWLAPGNIYAKRGTMSFYWRAREPLGPTPFPVFRVGYADHSSWDMVFLRIDWNGDGFDAFVTDNNLARVRVSYKLTAPLAADRWTLITFSWDETTGVVLYVDGKRVAANPQPAVLDAGLDQFGPHARAISPHQVHSADEFTRGGDIDDIRIYDHVLEGASVSALAAGSTPVSAAIDPDTERKAWLMRFGWDRPADSPVYLTSPQTRIRKVEFADQTDIKERMTLGSDGIDETTWPGVYNRSRLAGRHDYFELPDWNVYVDGGKAITFALPDEPWNHIEFTGAAYGKLTYTSAKDATSTLATRPAGEERSWYQFPAVNGGKLRFDNVVQETPIQELAAYNIVAGGEPDEQTLSYAVTTKASVAEYTALDDLTAYINGRYSAEERSTVVALPAGAPRRPATVTGGPTLPLVHILIPEDFRLTRAAEPLGRFGYGWTGLYGGLDGVALDIPPLSVKPGADGLIPLNIKVKDPLWSGRDLLDVDISVKPGEARTVFLDTRDRIMPEGKSFYMTVASAASDFDARQLDGMAVRLKFKPYADALPEHIADRFSQARDNLAFLVEEHSASLRLSRYARLQAELTDLLKVDPTNPHGREMWAMFHPEQGYPATPVPLVPAGAPKWAFLQTEDMKRVRHFIEWWIDNRQSAYGDFGGGISDDDDLTQQWPGLGLTGDIPDKLSRSVMALSDASFKNGMFTDGLNTIKTDALHTYEEGINAESETMSLDYGDPKVVERLMATAHAYPRIVQKREDGKTYFISHYFSSTNVSREEPWNWTELYSMIILHPGFLLGDYNNDPTMHAMVLALADNYIDRGKQRPDGSWSFPSELNNLTGAARGQVNGGGSGYLAFVQLFWAAYKWTGDAKYLRPLQSGSNLAASLLYLNGDAIAALGKPDLLEAKYKAAADKGDDDPYTLYQAWRSSGDTRYLDKAFTSDITDADRHMWLYTDAQWWIDRVELDSETLQRTRLGGIALRRGQTYPGHLVSWRFDTPTAAEGVGILVSEPGAGHFKVTAYNMTDKPVHAVMTGWDVTGGQWTATRTPDGEAAATTTVPFERTAGIDMVFAPGKTTTWDFTLAKAGDPVNSRADLGIGADDVRLDHGRMTVTVHSLGAKGTSESVVVLEDAAGRELARGVVPPLAPPLDLLPKTAHVTLKGKVAWASGDRVRIETPAGTSEITQLNNIVVAP